MGLFIARGFMAQPVGEVWVGGCGTVGTLAPAVKATSSRLAQKRSSTTLCHWWDKRSVETRQEGSNKLRKVAFPVTSCANGSHRPQGEQSVKLHRNVILGREGQHACKKDDRKPEVTVLSDQSRRWCAVLCVHLSSQMFMLPCRQRCLCWTGWAPWKRVSKMFELFPS